MNSIGRIVLGLATALLLGALAILPPSARGDGKVFPPVGVVRAETPSQRALIHWHAGTETLAVETTVASEATELGWVLPLPSPPLSIVPADPGLFPTLQNLFQPRVIFDTDSRWLAGAGVALVILIIRWRLQRKISISVTDTLAVLGFALILGFMLLPSLAKAKAKAEPTAAPRRLAPDLHVLSQVHAGVFDVTTLRASTSSALQHWLESHGLAVPPNLAGIVQDYLDQGWVFVASRVRNPAPGSITPLHPLVFRFVTPQPVYPMRLTGIGASRLDCDLYVFGPGRAAAKGWTTPYCGVPDFSPRTSPAMTPFPLRIRNAELASLVAGSHAATKLSAQLSAQDLAHDVSIEWQPVRPVGQTLRTWRSALTQALLPASWMLALAATLGCLAPLRIGTQPPWFSSIDRWGAGTAGVTALLLWQLIPQAPMADIDTLPRRAPSDLRHGLISLVAEAYDLPPMQAVLRLPTLADRSNALATARSSLTEYLRTHTPPTAAAATTTTATQPPPSPILNPFTGRPIRLESSPGNINLEATVAGLDLVWFDFDGAPAQRHEMPSP